MGSIKRTYSINVTEKKGSCVVVKGWVDRLRDHGGVLFVDLRDSEGKVQLVFHPRHKEAYTLAQQLGNECVIEIEGIVVERVQEAVNKNMPTGTVEVEVQKLTILSTSKPLPFPIHGDGHDIDENVRLKYRYLDLRRDRLQSMLRMKHRVILFIRNWLSARGFIEIQTPILTVSSPEGARDFLVPSRLHPGKFYALPQAPQQYKQLLMVAGIDKYFQIAPCFRDEDPRADRHSGDFYQVDIENAFVTQDEFFERMEPLFKDIVEEFTTKRILRYPFPRLTYWEAMKTYGSDRPDLRFEMKIIDLTDLARDSSMQIFKKAPVTKAIVLPGYATFSRKSIDDLTAYAQHQGAKGLAWIRVEESMSLGGPVAKFFTSEQQQQLLNSCRMSNDKDLVEGDMIVFIADEEMKALEILGKVRLYVGDELALRDKNTIAFAWITDFPMYEWKEEENAWDFMHNPFSMPQGGFAALEQAQQSGRIGDVLAYQYDIVANGLELSSGSLRNHDPETLIKSFELVGYSRKEIFDKFGHMIEAFSYGAPPHGGFAPGLDRMLMLLLDEQNIRDVYAFPKNGKAQDVMMNAPREVDPKTLDDLGITVKLKSR